MQKYYVYILEDANGKKYKGCTNNLERRFKEHQRGKTRTTSLMKNLKMVYVEEYESLQQARAREVYLKTAAGRRFLKSKLGD